MTAGVLERARTPALFGSFRADAAIFAGPALLAFALVALFPKQSDTPEWVWIAGVLLVDVAHVWSTLFRTYLDGAELRRRAMLYTLVPLGAYFAGFALYDVSALTFWRALAYLAVFHFVRQQYGWVALYRARAGETSWRWLDMAAIYAATLYPLLWWHTHLPRRFAWFVAGDFVALADVTRYAAPVYWLILAAYFGRSIARGLPNPGKDLVVLTTAVCWYGGIVVLDSDFAFTVTNVFIHGVPYLALVSQYQRAHGSPSSLASRVLRWGILPMLVIVAMLAFGEELLWDRTLWHERPWLFGTWSLATLELWLVPLLAVPQIAHYVLDGFIWRRKAAAPLF